jgi:hypothetical protein
LGVGKEMGLYFDAEDETFRERLYNFSMHSQSWFADIGIEYDLSPGIAVFSRIRVQRQTRGTKYEREVGNTDALTKYKSYYTALHFGIKF